MNAREEILPPPMFSTTKSTPPPHYLRQDFGGALIRWINDECVKAARQTPPDQDMVKAMANLGHSVENAIAEFDRANPDYKPLELISLTSAAVGDEAEAELSGPIPPELYEALRTHSPEELAGFLRGIVRTTKENIAARLQSLGD